MAKGKTHDRFNILLGAILSGLLLILGLAWQAFIAFNVGWMISTFFFSPDTDFMPKKRTGFLQFFLYPYSILFKHRGISHSLIFGTLTRILYVVIVSFVIFWVAYKMSYHQYSPQDYWKFIFNFFQTYQYQAVTHLCVTWLMLGMVMADMGHIFLDRVSSRLKRIF